MPILLSPQLRRLQHDASRRLGLRANPPKPHFLGIGTQKGGTSSLYHLLKLHPDVHLPARKEQHYFTTHYQRGDSWYSEQFTDALPGQVRGEITPYYLFHPDAPKRIHSYRPRMLFIILLRDPVERALSHYFHARRHGFETLPLEEALAAEPARLSSGDAYSHQKHSYVSRSLYIEQLTRYEALFDRRQLLILRSEDLFSEPEQSWSKIQNFLGLSPRKLLQALPWVNSGQREALDVPIRIRTRLRNELADTADAVCERYGIRWDWSSN
jgi:hypothetical protein